MRTAVRDLRGRGHFLLKADFSVVDAMSGVVEGRAIAVVRIDVEKGSVDLVVIGNCLRVGVLVD